jgi:hypothetical protein
MITEAIIWVFAHLVTFLIDLLPSWSAPAWLVTVTDTLADAVSYVGMLNGWVPIKAVGVAVVFMLGCSTLAFALKAGRMVLSLATGGGGSAA